MPQEQVASSQHILTPAASNVLYVKTKKNKDVYNSRFALGWPWSWVLKNWEASWGAPLSMNLGYPCVSMLREFRAARIQQQFQFQASLFGIALTFAAALGKAYGAYGAYPVMSWGAPKKVQVDDLPTRHPPGPPALGIRGPIDARRRFNFPA